MSVKLRVAVGAVVAVCVGCPTDAVSDGTGVALHVKFDAAAKLDHLHIAFALDGKPAFHVFDEPGKPAPLDPASTNVDILLPSSLANKTIAIAVDGFEGTSLLASGETDVKLVAGKKVDANVTLGAGESCGDGKVRKDIEQCDDGNNDDGDGCSKACAVEPGFQCAGEPSKCVPETCGDGVIDAGEQCDDANNDDGDGCSSTCQVEAGFTCTGAPSSCRKTCGDGVIDAGEECDDNNNDDGDGCSSTCAIESGYVCVGAPSVCAKTCGNGVVDANETCDDKNVVDGDGCSHACQVEAGFACTGAPSVCAKTCGNGVEDAGEQCDDGNTTDDDGCSSTCQVEAGFTCHAAVAGGADVCTATCGDGLVRGGEACDDGNTTAGDGCSPVCTVEPGFQCGGEPSTCTGACNLAGGVNVPAGSLDPNNPCRICDPAQNATDYVDDDGAPCDDGVFCDGADTCSGGACTVHAGSPCTAATQPTCDEGNARCDCTQGSCDDGTFCNGAETCDAASGTCAAGAPPTCTAPTPVCNAAKDACAACSVDADCTDAQNPSCLNGVCVCAGCGCPTGEHDGGDGNCVASGSCSPGFSFAFVDADGDGVGAGPLTQACIPGPPFGPGFSALDTDCNDGDPTVFQVEHVFPDRDGDGFTAAGEDDCVGATLPPTLKAAAQPAPFLGLECLSATSSGGGNSWQSTSEAERLGGNHALSGASGGTRSSENLFLTHYALQVPASATVTGVEVHVFRRQGGGGGTDFIADNLIELTKNGTQVAGTNHAQPPSTHWAVLTGTAFEEAVYGGPTDMWGLALSPNDVNATGFGVVISAEMTHSNQNPGMAADIDGVVVRVFTSDTSRIDCADNDAQKFALTTVRTDADNDRFGFGTPQVQCLGTSLPANFVEADEGDDCFDANPNAHPGTTGAFAVDRGDGSFDYNCDGTISRVPTSVEQDTSCICDTTALTCAVGTLTNHNTSNAACGSTVNSASCSNVGATCSVDTDCTLTAGTTTVRCR